MADQDKPVRNWSGFHACTMRLSAKQVHAVLVGARRSRAKRARDGRFVLNESTGANGSLLEHFGSNGITGTDARRQLLQRLCKGICLARGHKLNSLGDCNALRTGVALDKGAPVVNGEVLFCSHFS